MKRTKTDKRKRDKNRGTQGWRGENCSEWRTWSTTKSFCLEPSSDRWVGGGLAVSDIPEGRTAIIQCTQGLNQKLSHKGRREGKGGGWGLAVSNIPEEEQLLFSAHWGWTRSRLSHKGRGEGKGGGGGLAVSDIPEEELLLFSAHRGWTRSRLFHKGWGGGEGGGGGLAVSDIPKEELLLFSAHRGWTRSRLSHKGWGGGEGGRRWFSCERHTWGRTVIIQFTQGLNQI